MDLPGSSVHGILQKEYWSGLIFLSPRDLPDPGLKPGSPALQADIFFFTIWATREVLIWGSGLLQKTPQRHMDYFELKLLEKQLVQEEDSDPSFCAPWNQEMSLSCERQSLYLDTERHPRHQRQGIHGQEAHTNNPCYFLLTFVVPKALAFQPSLVAQRVKHLPAMQETQVQSLGWEDPLEKEMATHFSILAWRIPWMEEPSRLQSKRSQRVRHNWATSLSEQSPNSIYIFH